MLELINGCSRDVLRRMASEGRLVDAVVTDPPYGLTSIVKRFGKTGAAKAKFGKDGAFSRLSQGFMGSQWDGTGIENDAAFWELVYGTMKPGAYIVAFSSPRTYHKMATAIEDAGFITHPMISWIYASGMPKAHDAARAIDRTLGQYRPGDSAHHVPSSDEAQPWKGWVYGGQARKPAQEPIYVGQKPFSEKSGALNILKHGVGAVNIDGCRVPGEAVDPGRWPANLIHDGSPEVKALFPDSDGHDSGSASRFFEVYPFDGVPIIYQQKANKHDRAGSTHPTVKPVALIRALVRHVCPPGGTVLDPFAGSGTTGSAADAEGMNAVLIEKEVSYWQDMLARFKVEVSSGGEDNLEPFKNFMRHLNVI